MTRLQDEERSLEAAIDPVTAVVTRRPQQHINADAADTKKGAGFQGGPGSSVTLTSLNRP
jgi:hypothetical protein